MSVSSSPSRHLPLTRAASLAALVLGGVLAACGDQGPRRCTVEIAGGEELIIVAGTSGPVRALATCDRGTPEPIRWSVSDPRAATVDPTGLVVGLVPGEVTLVAEIGGRAPARAEKPLIVAPPYILLPSPTELSLVPRRSTVLSVATIALNVTPPGFPRALDFRSADTCVAQITPAGLVTAGRPGTTDVIVTLRAAPGVQQRIPVTVGVPAAGQLAIQSVTTAGASPVPVDPTAVRGRIALTVSLANGIVAQEGGRLDVRLGGRLAASVLLSRAANDAGEIRTPIVVDTEARDAFGARLFPNGPQPLSVTLVVPDVTPAGGCPFNLGSTVVREVTVANP